MTATAASRGRTAGRTGGRTGWVVVLVAVAVVLVALAAGSPPREAGRPYDPEATTAEGTRALVELLERFGAEVDVTSDQPPADADVALALPGVVPEDREQPLRAWVAEGRTLVVADLFGTLAPPTVGASSGFGFVGERRVEQEDCDIVAVADARTLYVGDSAARRFEVPGGAGRCYARAGAALVVSVPEGRGQVVSVGAPAVFTNEHIDEDDNAVLAVDLLAPRPGTRVAVLQEPEGRSAEPTTPLGQLLPTGVRVALVQLVAAFVVYAVVRGRRLGRPVREPQAVEIAGSELVAAVGNLLQQTGSPERAAGVLRRDLRRRLCERLGLPVSSSPEVIAATAEVRSGVDRQRVLQAVGDVPCPDEAALVALARSIDALREEVLHGRTP